MSGHGSIRRPLVGGGFRPSRPFTLVVALTLAVGVVQAVTFAAAPRAIAAGTGGQFVPAQGRILDTRPGTQVGPYSTAMPAGTWRKVQVDGVVGIPSTGVSAVTVTFTAINPTADGLINADEDEATPNTVVDYLAYQARSGIQSNTATVAVADDGMIQVRATNASTNLVMDVEGYYTENDAVAPGGYVPVTPTRLIDTRDGTGIHAVKLTGGSTTTLPIGGSGGIPLDATAAMLNFTIVNNTSTGDRYFTPYPADDASPPTTTLTLHFESGVMDANAAQVGLATTGADAGAIKFFLTGSGYSVDLTVDVVGYFAPGTSTGAFTTSAARVYDSRNTGHTTIAAGSTVRIPVAGVSGLPAAGSGISSVTADVTAINASSTVGNGYLTIWADGKALPTPFSSMHYEPNATTSNFVTSALGSNGDIDVYNGGSVAVNFVIDVEGWYASPGPAQPVVSSDQLVEDAGNAPTNNSVELNVGGDEADNAAATTFFTYALDGASSVTVAGPAAAITLANDATLGEHHFIIYATDQYGVQSASSNFTWFTGSDPSNVTGLTTTLGSSSAKVEWSPPPNNGGMPIVGYSIQALDETSGTGQFLGSCTLACRSAVLTNLLAGHSYDLTITARTAIGESDTFVTVSSGGSANLSCGGDATCLQAAAQAGANATGPLSPDANCTAQDQSSGNCLGAYVTSGEDPIVAAVSGTISMGDVAKAQHYAQMISPQLDADTRTEVSSAMSTAESGDRTSAVESLNAYNALTADRVNGEPTADEYSGDFSEQPETDGGTETTTDGLPAGSPNHADTSTTHVPIEAQHGDAKAIGLFRWAYKGKDSGEYARYGYADKHGQFHALGTAFDEYQSNVYFPIRDGDHRNRNDGAFWYMHVETSTGPGLVYSDVKIELKRDLRYSADPVKEELDCPGGGGLFNTNFTCDGYSTYGSTRGHYYYYEVTFTLKAIGKYPRTGVQIQTRRYVVNSSTSWDYPAGRIGG